MTSRAAIITQIATLLDNQDPGHPWRVAIDGVTSSGKTTLAGEVADALTVLGRPVIRLTMDGYHHPREHRYQQGRMSPGGYYEDAYDFDAFARLVLTPLGPGGDRRYHRRIIDLAADTPVTDDTAIATPGSVLVVDGNFLQRPPIMELWDCRIFVETSLPVARRRGVARDAAQLGGTAAADHLYAVSYHAAAARYLAEMRPAERCDLRVENDDLARPVLVHQSGASWRS